MDFVQNTQGFSGKEHARMGFHGLVPNGGVIAEVHIIRLLFLPGFNQRLEAVAVTAAIPEHLDHLDFGFVPGRYRTIQHCIVFASDVFFLGHSGGGHHSQQQACEDRAGLGFEALDEGHCDSLGFYCLICDVWLSDYWFIATAHNFQRLSVSGSEGFSMPKVPFYR